MRFAGEAIGVAAAVLGIVGVATAATAYLRASVRYRRAHEGLTNSGELPIDGLALGLVALTLLLIAGGAAIYVIGVGVQALSGAD